MPITIDDLLERIELLQANLHAARDEITVLRVHARNVDLFLADTIGALIASNDEIRDALRLPEGPAVAYGMDQFAQDWSHDAAERVLSDRM
jgi:hypothetical protein